DEGGHRLRSYHAHIICHFCRHRAPPLSPVPSSASTLLRTIPGAPWEATQQPRGRCREPARGRGVRIFAHPYCRGGRAGRPSPFDPAAMTPQNLPHEPEVTLDLAREHGLTEEE